jgi:hypothetical protein
VLPLVANEDCAEQREDRAKLPQHEVPPGVRAPVRQDWRSQPVSFASALVRRSGGGLSCESFTAAR